MPKQVYENEQRLLGVQIVVHQDLLSIEITGERIRDIGDYHRQTIPPLDVTLEDVEDLAKTILGHDIADFEVMPSFCIRDRSVLGFTPNKSAAPNGPCTRPSATVSARRM